MTSETKTAIIIDPNSIESLAAAIQAGVTNPELLADWLDGAELTDAGELVLSPRVWHADDGNCEIEIDDCDSAEEAATRYVEGGDWGEPAKTAWVHVYAWRIGLDTDGEQVQVDREWTRVAIDPEEPECSSDEGHDWDSPHEIVGGIEENPGVWGHGGGVVIHAVCRHCGCERVTDTWAQDPENGVQGLESVEYHPGKYAEQVAEFYAEDEDEDEDE